VKLLCHFMFRRAQERADNRMRLDLDVLEEVRHQLERERNIAARPVLTAIRALDPEGLTDLAVLVGADGNATVEELWQAEYALYGASRHTQAGLSEACQRLIAAGVLDLPNDRVTFCGDEFDRLYATYFAQSCGIDLAFPPRATFPLDVYWKVILGRWLRKQELQSVGLFQSGEDRKQLDDVGLYTMLNALSGATDDAAVFEQNTALALDLYLLMERGRHQEHAPICRARLQLGSVDVTGLFTGPPSLDDDAWAAINAKVNAVQLRIAEMKGNLQADWFNLPIYSFDRITDTIIAHGGETFRRLVANIHATFATMLYSDPVTRSVAQFHAELTDRYGADVWPVMANNVAYVLLAVGRLDDARRILQRVLGGADGSFLQPLVHYNLGVTFAKLGEFDLALQHLRQGSTLIHDHDEEGRKVRFLLVGKTVSGRLVFGEEEGPDLAVAIAETIAALEEACRKA
jgi:tetratricopeptide (TPR) repeat protein